MTDPKRLPSDAELAEHYYEAFQSASGDRVHAKLLAVTPEMATGWLGKNVSNRRKRNNVISALARAIRCRLWMVNGEAIIIDTDGNLLDGQHRLEAIVSTGVPIPCMVAFNIRRAAFLTLDQGSKRTAGDVLGMEGVPHHSDVAASLSYPWRHEHQMLGSEVVGRPNASAAELLDLLNNHQGILKSSAYFASKQAGRIAKPGMFIFLHYVCTNRHPDQEQFFDNVLTGVGITDRDSVAFLLRKRLIDNAANKAKLPPIDILALSIKAWNMHILGSTGKNLRWTRSHDHRESFPSVL